MKLCRQTILPLLLPSWLSLCPCLSLGDRGRELEGLLRLVTDPSPKPSLVIGAGRAGPRDCQCLCQGQHAS